MSGPISISPRSARSPSGAVQIAWYGDLGGELGDELLGLGQGDRLAAVAEQPEVAVDDAPALAREEGVGHATVTSGDR